MFGPHWDENNINGNQDIMYSDRERLGIIPRAIEQIF